MAGHGHEAGLSHHEHSAQNIVGGGIVKGIAEAIMGFMDEGFAKPTAQLGLDLPEAIRPVIQGGTNLGAKPVSGGGGHGGGGAAHH